MGNILQYRSLILLLSVFTVILSSPFWETSEVSYQIFAFIWVAGIGAGGYMLTRSRTWLSLFSLLVGGVLILDLTNSFSNPSYHYLFSRNLLIASVQFLALFAALKFAFSRSIANAIDRTIASITGYFILSLLWTRFYALAILNDPTAITGLSDSAILWDRDLIYYSLVTLTTQGYGDIVPISPGTRLLASLEGAFGTLYLAVLIAGFVGEMKLFDRQRD